MIVKEVYWCVYCKNLQVPRKRDPVIKLGWARNNHTVDTLECPEYDGTTLICWRDYSNEQSARAIGNFRPLDRVQT